MNSRYTHTLRVYINCEDGEHKKKIECKHKYSKCVYSTYTNIVTRRRSGASHAILYIR